MHNGQPIMLSGQPTKRFYLLPAQQLLHVMQHQRASFNRIFLHRKPDGADANHAQLQPQFEKLVVNVSV